MDVNDLDRSDMDYENMDIISEQEIPLDVDPKEIKENLVIAAQYMGGYRNLDERLEVLKKQKKTVLAWFKEQKENIEKQQDFLKSKLDLALEYAKQLGESKPKIKTWAGTAYRQRSRGFDWNGHDNTSPKVIELAKKHGVEVEIIEKTDLGKLKQELTEEDLKYLGASRETGETLVIRKA